MIMRVEPAQGFVESDDQNDDDEEDDGGRSQSHALSRGFGGGFDVFVYFRDFHYETI